VGENSIHVIHPYKHEGTWVFDDPSVGLVQEPFVDGADAIIERLVAAIPDAARGFTLLFAAAPFAGANARLDWRRADAGGNWYYLEALAMEGWLCPALFKYFSAAPPTLYVQCKPKGR
jgi:hypothetical protein